MADFRTFDPCNLLAPVPAVMLAAVRLKRMPSPTSSPSRGSARSTANRR